MDCIKAKSIITEYIYDEAEAADVHMLEEHIKECEDCRKALNNSRKAIDNYRAIKRTPAPDFAVKNALNIARKEADLQLAKRKTQRMVILRPYLKYFRHPAFAAASIVMVLGIVIINSWQSDDEFVRSKTAAVRDVSADSLDSEKDEAEKSLPPIESEKAENRDVSEDVQMMVEKAQKKIELLHREEMKIPEPSKQEAAPLPEMEGVSRPVAKSTVAPEINASPESKNNETRIAGAVVENRSRRSVPKEKVSDKNIEPEIDRAAVVKKDEENFIPLNLANSKPEEKPAEELKELTLADTDGPESVDLDLEQEAVAKPLVTGKASEDDVVENVPDNPKAILKKAFGHYQKHRYNDALYYLGKIPDTAGDITVAAVELEILCHNYLGNKEAVEQGLDVLTRLDQALGARLAQEIGQARKAESEGEKAGEIAPRSRSLEN